MGFVQRPLFRARTARCNGSTERPGSASAERKQNDAQGTVVIKVAILGGSGYTALELIKILLRHPGVEIAAVTSRQSDTPRLAELHPSLTGRIDLRCEPFDADRLAARGVQCVFSCLPHGASMA